MVGADRVRWRRCCNDLGPNPIWGKALSLPESRCAPFQMGWCLAGLPGGPDVMMGVESLIRC